MNFWPVAGHVFKLSTWSTGGCESGRDMKNIRLEGWKAALYKKRVCQPERGHIRYNALKLLDSIARGVAEFTMFGLEGFGRTCRTSEMMGRDA